MLDNPVKFLTDSKNLFGYGTSSEVPGIDCGQIRPVTEFSMDFGISW
jgi:hypothetical protein